MEFTLKRIERTGATSGEILMDGNHVCYTLEDMVRPEGEFVRGVTAIPYGKYRMITNFSNRFKRQMIQVINLRGSSIQFGDHSIDAAGIRLHGGNTPEDSLGCILCGTSVKPDGTIYDCAPAVNKIFSMVDEADKREEVYLNIVKVE